MPRSRVRIQERVESEEHLETEIENTDHKISLYYKSEEKIESNHKLNEQISDITKKLSKLQIRPTIFLIPIPKISVFQQKLVTI